MFKAMCLSALLGVELLFAAHPEPRSFQQPLLFEQNRGQAQAQVTWIARGPGYQLFLTKDGLTVAFRERGSNTFSFLRMSLAASKAWTNIVGLQPTGGVSNYLQTAGMKEGLANIPHFQRLSVQGVYEGVDLILYSSGAGLEYDFVLQAGADPRQIQLRFSGQAGIRIDARSGDLIIKTASGLELRQKRPTVYQLRAGRRVQIHGSYQLLGSDRAGFTLGDYDRRTLLVIDPSIGFIEFQNNGDGYALTVDANGNSYITGRALKGFPVTTGASFLQCDTSNGWFGFKACYGDIFVTKLDPAGNVVFSTFTGPGEGLGITTDSSGNVYATGVMNDIDGCNICYGGGDNLFFLRMNSSGGIVYFRVYAGDNTDIGKAIAVDSQQNAWIVGSTSSLGHGKNDVLIMMYDPQGYGHIIAAMGGSGDDAGNAVVIDKAGTLWITGQTCSSDFPSTAGGNPLRQGNCGVFVLGMASANAMLENAVVFYGSPQGDSGTGIAIDPIGQLTITGYTYGPFPTTIGAFQTTRGGSGAQAFVTKLDSVLAVTASTLLGNDGNTLANAIALNTAGEIYIVGSTTATIFPGAGPMSLNPTAGFVSKFSPDLSTLFYSLQIGDVSNSVVAFEELPTVTTTQIFATGWQHFNNSDHAYVDRLSDDMQLSRIRNYWHPDQYINTESGHPTTSPVGLGWWSAQWEFDVQPTTNGDPPNTKVFWIRNRWQPSQYLNIESGSLQNTPIDPSWLSARWTLEQIPGTTLYRIRNVWQPAQCLNIQTGTLVAGPVAPGCWSS